MNKERFRLLLTLSQAPGLKGFTETVVAGKTVWKQHATAAESNGCNNREVTISNSISGHEQYTQ